MAQSLDQLSRIDISGYKSIKHCSIELKKTNVIIGSNGAGKSNFISIFALLQDILAKNLQVAVGQNGLNSLFYNGRKITEEIAAEVFFGKNSYGFNLIPTDDNRIIFKKEGSKTLSHNIINSSELRRYTFKSYCSAILPINSANSTKTISPTTVP